MLLVLKRFFSHPALFIPCLVLIGSLAAVSDPDYAHFVDAHILKLWTPEAGPRIVNLLLDACAVIAGSSLAFSCYRWWRSGAPERAVRRSEREREAFEMSERVAAAFKRREDEDYRAWVRGQIGPLIGLLERNGEAALVPEIEAMFANRKDGESQTLAERRHAIEIAQWLVVQAVRFSRDAAADPATNQAKIHQFVDRALMLANQHNAWLVIRDVADSAAVVAPVFAGQRGVYVPSTGLVPSSNEFVRFLAWLAEENAPKTPGIAVAPGS